MIRQVEISTGMNSFHFPETKGEMKFNIAGCISIVGQFIMIVETVFFISHSKSRVPAKSFFFPIIIPLYFFSRLNKELHFHLFKFTHSENELPGNYFIPKCFSGLRNSKRNFHSTGFLNIQKINKNTLGSFWS